MFHPFRSLNFLSEDCTSTKWTVEWKGYVNSIEKPLRKVLLGNKLSVLVEEFNSYLWEAKGAKTTQI